MEKYPVIDVIATSKQIDALRKGKGLSVKDLQEVFGFSTPQAVYNWIWGTSLPSSTVWLFWRSCLIPK